MTQATGVRIGWADLPGKVRSAIEDLLGSPVVEAVSQPGGFSPGTADRVRTAAGTRAFVKAVSMAQNPGSVEFHRREAAVTARLPAEAAAPRLLGTYDDGEWVALVLEDVPGRPRTPTPRSAARPADQPALIRCRSVISARLSSLETCIWEMPSCSAICACVRFP
jgi:hypothetical protein